jgi:hypothetical protein
MMRVSVKAIQAFVMVLVLVAAVVSILCACTEKEGAALVIMYRSTFHGFLEAQGYDTLVYRFTALPGGWLTGVSVFERRIEGDREVATYVFSRPGNMTMVTGTAYGEPVTLGEIRNTENGLRVEGDGDGRIYRLQPDGVLKIRRDRGGEEEVWRASRSDGAPGADLSGWAKGTFAFPDLVRSVYAERRFAADDSSEDTTYSIRHDEEDRYRVSVDGVEPVCEAVAANLGEFLSGVRALEDFALIELVLGPERNLRPLLAYVLAEKTNRK